MKSKSGFTLVELIIVIVVIAVLAAISVVAYNGITARSRDASRIATINTITKALELYFIDNDHYPIINTPASGACTTTNAAISGCPSWNDFAAMLKPYTGVDTLPLDPKNNLGSTTSPATFIYIYQPMQNNSGWPLLCSGTQTKTYQAYYLQYFTENASVNNRINGSCSNNNPYYGSSPGVKFNNYIGIHW